MASFYILELVKTNLGHLHVPAPVEENIIQAVDAAEARLRADGIPSDECDPDSVRRLIMQACMIYKQTTSDAPMPRSLRRSINDGKIDALKGGAK